MSDEDVIPMLHELKSVTFFTLDEDYYQRRLLHASYCLVYIAIKDKTKVPVVIRRFLSHRTFRTWAQRKGKVIRVMPESIHIWRLHAKTLEKVGW